MKTVLLRDGRKQWRATVDDVKVTYEFGVVDGKQQSETTIYTEGKNIGKSNETTPAQQCMADALVKIRKKMEKGYKLIEGDLDAPVETTSNLEAPKPMLAQDLHDHLKKLTIVESLFFQPKLDGNRALIDLTNGKMYSRNRKEIPHLSHISEAVVVACQELISVGIRWVDGELYSPNMSFNMIQTLIRRVSGDSKTKRAHISKHQSSSRR
jgi:DNA ligase 1